LTVVELLIVAAMIGVLAAIAGPLLVDSSARAKVVRATTDIRILSREIDAYATVNGTYPDSLADIGKAAFLDPWRRPYLYLNIANAPPKAKGAMRKDRFLVPLNSDYDLCSAGPDGRSSPPLTARGSRDDIIRANDGGFIGVAADY
jgi:general secretion pathway protein G